MTVPLRIAIDGPAASGKSTVGKLVAERLRYLYFDTGVMYRAVTLACLERGIPIADEAAVTRVAQSVHIDVTRPTKADGRQYTVLLDGRDVTWEIRGPEVDANVSPVSAYPGVRAALTAQQRRIGAAGRVVMVGRDIGTVVMPDAELKVYLDAAVEERARRRSAEIAGRGEPVEYEAVLHGMVQRDAVDSSRTTAPLQAAADAVVIDTTCLSIDQVVQAVMALATRAGEA